MCLYQFFLNLDERYFNVEKVKITDNLEFKKEEIVECRICGELQPKNYMKVVDNALICKMCLNEKYFKVIGQEQI